MNESKDTLTELAQVLLKIFRPLEEAFSSEDKFKALMYRLGWQVDGLPPAYVELGGTISEEIAYIEQLVEEGADESDFAEMVPRAKKLYTDLQNLSTAPPGVNASAFLNEIGERLIELLLVEYLSSQVPMAYNLLSALDVIELENLTPSGDKDGYIRTKFKWEEIPEIVKDPVSIVQRIYGWGTPKLELDQIFDHLSAIFYALGFPVGLTRPDEELLLGYLGSDIPVSQDSTGLKIPFYYVEIGDKSFELAIRITEYPAHDSNLPGLILEPVLPEEVPFTFKLAEEIDLIINVESDLKDHFGVILQPDLGIDVKYPFKDDKSLPSAGFGLKFDFHPETSSPLIGSADGTRLESKGGVLGFEVFSESGEFHIQALSEVNGLAFVLAGGNGDGFIQKILGDEDIRVEMPLGVDWSSKHGFGFRGSINFEITFNPHLSLGFIEIQQTLLSIGVPQADEPKINSEASLNVSGNLGPIQFAVERIGLSIDMVFEEGNLGPLDLDIGFKPPNGVGLSVDAGPVKGGGYLYFDYDREEYAGALELVFSDWIALKAIGLITTKLPDGSKGFSMLIIITVEFGTGIQLGFGFTLLGVGGLLGINRIVNVEPLKDGVRTGAVESVMFPEDVIANAPRIISDLRKFFPPQNDLFLLGPMAKIGWGTPTLINISIGIIMEIPSVNITILGVIKVVLPDEEADILRLQVNFIGRIEPSNERLWFYAELFDSRVLFITLEGGMGLLVGWGDNANFVVSVGGFHPRYSPPPLPFPEPPRIAVSILNESYAKVRIEAYFAVTSNSVQFGAKAELFFGVSEFKIEGFLVFDALFQFDPFFFSFALSVSLSVKVFGVGLFSVGFSGILEGPTPWYIEGKGKISLLFFKIKVPFSHTWGDEEDTKLDPIEVFPLIEKELNALTNWVAQLPETSNILVSLRKLGESEEDELVLHPAGTLRISQRKLPLNFTMDKVGNQRPSDVNELKVEASINGDNLAISEIEEKFAIGQFKDLDDSKRLSSPAFEPLEGGVEMAVEGEQIKTSQAVKRVIRYESIIIDSYYKRFVKPFFEFFVAGFTGLYEFLFEHFITGNAVSKSELSYHHKKRMQPFDEVIQVKPQEFSVAFNTNNKPMDGEATSFTSQAKAAQFMEQKIQDDPKLADELHVIPNTEINTAA